MFKFRVIDINDLSAIKKDFFTITGKIEEGDIRRHEKGYVVIEGKEVQIMFHNTAFIRNHDVLNGVITMVIDKPECDIEKLKGLVVQGQLETL